MYKIIKYFLFLFDGETIHQISLKLLNLSYRFKLLKPFSTAKDPITLMGMTLPNCVGLAAGLDKNGDYIDALASLGFGFIEIGTVTPKAQQGNPKPRLFRIPEYQAIINRMGFNNKGIDYMVNKIKNSKFTGILGVNIGKNADTPIENAIDDYLICLTKVYSYASYIVINISSPNTKNLRELQTKENIEHLLITLKEAQKKLTEQHKKYTPLVVKIAPDLDEHQIKDIAKVLLKVKLDGVICSNTTVDKSLIENHPLKNQDGGLSGKPLFKKSNQVLKLLAKELDNQIPIIGVGGIGTGKDALTKLELGASAIQLYTGLIYQGPGLIKRCVKKCIHPLNFD